VRHSFIKTALRKPAFFAVLMAVSVFFTACGGHKQAKVQIPAPPPIQEPPPQSKPQQKPLPPTTEAKVQPPKTVEIPSPSATEEEEEKAEEEKTTASVPPDAKAILKKPEWPVGTGHRSTI